MNVRLMKCATLLLSLIVLGPGCSPPPSQSGNVPKVYTTFYPTTYFAQRIAGDNTTGDNTIGNRAEVVCLLPDDEDPIFWQPSAETIEAYQGADLIVVNGARFEKWVAKTSLPPSKVVNTAAPLADEFITFVESGGHSHGSDTAHAHKGVDGHTWLDPHYAKVQADEIRKALTQLLPDQADAFQANYAALAADLDELDRLLTDLSVTLEDEHLLASHPAYNYLVKRYGWQLTSFDLDPAEMPSDAALAEIGKTLESTPARVILWESPPDEAVADRLKEEFGLISVWFSPCETLDEASRAAGGDYLSVMKENIIRLRDATAPSLAPEPSEKPTR